MVIAGPTIFDSIRGHIRVITENVINHSGYFSNLECSGPLNPNPYALNTKSRLFCGT